MSVAEAKAKLGQPKPEAFKFGEDGDEIDGTVVRMEMGMTPYGSIPIVIIDTVPDGAHHVLRSVWLTHKALRGAVSRLQPQRGDGIAIRCLGEREGKNGKTYIDYEAAIDREQPFSWDEDNGKKAEQNPFDGEPPF